MSSTDPSITSLKGLFENELNCKTAPEPNDGSAAPASFWQSREKRPLYRRDEGTGLAALLAARWSAEGRDDLVGLAEPLAAIAEQLRGTDDDWEDVSPYIYAMF